ncbi:hypothetical protein VSU19_14905 [Verrucomicrobiales bacterium BCK34]|nr:hypothetical protein [Verrucomicrobiales bacterium BCK34]
MNPLIAATAGLLLSSLSSCAADDDFELKGGHKSHTETEAGGFAAPSESAAVMKSEPILLTNTYVVPPSFQKRFLQAYEPKPTDPNPNDPFSEPPAPKAPQRLTAKQIIESAGVTFGPGAAVIYSIPTSAMIVRNTQDQLELVEAYFESLLYSMETGIRIHLDIFEASSLELKKLTEQSSTTENHADALKQSLKLCRENTLKHINSSSVEMYPGEKATINSGYDLTYVSGYEIKAESTIPVLKTANIGTSFECIAVPAADLTSIDLRIDFDHHFALPTFKQGKFPMNGGPPLDFEIPTFSKASIDTTILIIDGHTRILGTFPVHSTNPDAESRTQIAFLTAGLFFSEGAQKVYDEQKFNLQTGNPDVP